MLILLGTFVLGVVVGYFSTIAIDERGRIERFVQVDQKHLERWKAYCELESRIKSRGGSNESQ